MGAAFAGTPLVTTSYPDKFRNFWETLEVAEPSLNQYRIDRGATNAPPNALSISPTDPWCCLARSVQISASLYSCVLWRCGSLSNLSSSTFGICQLYTKRSIRIQQRDAPSGSRQRADPLIFEDSTGSDVCVLLASRDGWVCFRRRGDGDCSDPAGDNVA